MERLDRLIHPPRPDPLEPERILPRLVRSEWGRFRPGGSLTDLRLDVVVDFTRGGTDCGLHPLPRYGCWSILHGGERDLWGMQAAIDELLSGDPVAGAALEVRAATEVEDGILRSVQVRTDLQSLARTRSQLYWASTGLVPSALGELSALGQLPRRDGASSSPKKKRDVGIFPGFASLRLAGKMVGRVVRNRASELLHRERWIIGYRFSDDSGSRSHRPETSLDGCPVLEPTDGRSWADPFPVYRDGRFYVFLEEFGGDLPHGHLSVLELARDGTASVPRPILRDQHHISHPFVFTWKGQDFLVPETRSTRRIELYRARQFPHAWRLEDVLLDREGAVDATLFQHHDRWWMFVNRSPESFTPPDVELHLYWALTPMGPWSPHPLNPVVTDVRRARPAGRLFRSGRHLIRPGQDCSLRYGGAIVLNEVIELDPKRYRERPFARIEPTWAPNLVGTHTLNADRGLTVVDGLRREPRWDYGFSGRYRSDHQIMTLSPPGSDGQPVLEAR